MALHARNIALVAGAAGAEIDTIARRMAAERDVRTDRALALLEELRNPR
jgi:hydroxymethylglutaryl-CoA reductase